MICGGCGNQNAFRTVCGAGWEVCDQCGETGSNLEPDVYVRPGVPEENLPDDPRTGKPPVFYSKREMSNFLREHRLVQVRDREHGGVSMPGSIDAKRQAVDRNSASWHKQRMTVKMIREMGIDVRRQAALKAAKGL